jgi:hypothetical protein
MHCAMAVDVALVPGGSRMNRMRACDAVRRAVAPHRQVQPLLSGCGLGSRRIAPSIDQLYVRSHSDSPLRGERPTARCGPRITFVSSKWTTRNVDQVPNTEAFANLPQFDSSGRKETAQQSIPAEPLHPLMPAQSAAIQPLENPGQLGRDRGLSLANEPTGTNVDRYRQQGCFIENCHALKPLSKKVPRVLSCRLARRDNGSFKHFINQLRLCSLPRRISLGKLDQEASDREAKRSYPANLHLCWRHLALPRVSASYIAPGKCPILCGT